MTLRSGTIVLTSIRVSPVRFCDERVGQQVKASFLASDWTYRALRVWRDLLAAGVACGLHRVERLMRVQTLRARPRRRLPKDSGDRSIAVVPSNLLDRQFKAAQANQKWIADFIYIWIAEGWLYVAAVIGLFFAFQVKLIDKLDGLGFDRINLKAQRYTNAALSWDKTPPARSDRHGDLIARPSYM